MEQVLSQHAAPLLCTYASVWTLGSKLRSLHGRNHNEPTSLWAHGLKQEVTFSDFLLIAHGMRSYLQRPDAGRRKQTQHLELPTVVAGRRTEFLIIHTPSWSDWILVTTEMHPLWLHHTPLLFRDVRSASQPSLLKKRIAGFPRFPPFRRVPGKLLPPQRCWEAAHRWSLVAKLIPIHDHRCIILYNWV